MVPRSLQRTFEQFFTLKDIGLKRMSQKMLNNINKLLLQRRKNRSEMKASFLFNILGTIADNLRALIYTHIKDKSTKLPFEAKDSKHLVGTNGDDSSAVIEFTPL